MDIPRLRTRIMRVAIAVGFVSLVAWYSPVLTAAGWRVFHPRGRALYRGLVVRVPWPWIAETETVEEDTSANPEGLMVRRLGDTLGQRARTEFIFVNVISADPAVTEAQQTKAWLEMFRTSHPGATFEERDNNEGAGARCVTARGSMGETDAVSTCISVRGGWVANFEGRQEELPVFSDVTGHLKRRQ